MSDDAFIYLASDTHAPIGAPLTAIGRLDCMETPAVMGWLQAHGVTSASSKVRILPPEAGPVIPEQAERLAVPLSPEETQVVRQACAPSATGNVEAELIEYRQSTEDREVLVSRALTHGVPAHRIVELTGIEAEFVGDVERRSQV